MSNFGAAEAGGGGYPAPAGGGGYPAPSTHDNASPSNPPASYPDHGVQQDTMHNDNPDHQHAPAVPVGRLPLDPMSSLLRSMAFICFMLFGAACMYALVTPYWYSSKTGSDTGTVLSPFYSCVRSAGNQFSCTALTLGESRISIPSSGCATNADDTAMWMYIIRACVLLAGGAAGITAVIIIINLAVYPAAKAPLAITTIIGGGISSLGWAAAVATTVIGISDKLVCGDGLCGTDASCNEFWMSAAWVLFIGGAFTVAGFAVVLIDYILRVMRKPKGAIPPAHHHQTAPAQQANGASTQQPQQQQGGMSQQATATTAGAQQQPNTTQGQTQQPNNEAASQQSSPQQQQVSQQQASVNQQPNNNTAATTTTPVGGATAGHPSASHQESAPQHQPDAHAYPNHATNNTHQSKEHKQEQEQEMAPVGEESVADGSQFHHEGFELPEGDWVWDSASNMYWSESQYLFLNPQNSHFYDPNSNKWYNPETEEWYDEGEQ